MNTCGVVGQTLASANSVRGAMIPDATHIREGDEWNACVYNQQWHSSCLSRQKKIARFDSGAESGSAHQLVVILTDDSNGTVTRVQIQNGSNDWTMDI